jgi:hypothetical protein
LEIWAAIALSTAVVAITGMTVWALRPMQRRSPDPMLIDLPREEVFAKIHNYISKPHLDMLAWNVKEKVTGRFIAAELTYNEEFENKAIRCDAIVNFDFKTQQEGATTLRWSCQFKHWCDLETARRLEGQISSWLQALFEKPHVLSKIEKHNELLQNTDLKSQGSEEPDDKDYPQLEFFFEARRPLPQTFDRFYQRLLSNQNSIQPWKLSITEKTDSESIRCDFHVKNEINVTTLPARIHFTFCAIGKTKTKVTWKYTTVDPIAFKDNSSLRERADDWIRLVLTA